MREAERMGYSIPFADPEVEQPALKWPHRGAGRVRKHLGKYRQRRHGKRLAVVDLHFPWRRSGFRYHEALEIHRQLPDAVFFSLFELTDPFPTRVYPLNRFPLLAPAMGVSDVYGVFVNFLSGLIGLPDDGGGPAPRDGINISSVLHRNEMRLHSGIYPGGGLLINESIMNRVRAITERSATAMTWVPEVLEQVPGTVHVDPAFVNPEFYPASAARWAIDDQLVLVFAADDRPRKGIETVIRAFNELDEDFFLHIAGSNERHLSKLTNPCFEYHGSLDPSELRTLYERSHVFVSPVWSEDPSDPEGDGGVTDGFPTATAADAVASGCCLVSGNPQNVTNVFTPGTDYLEIDGHDSRQLAQVLRRLRADRELCRSVAERGATRAREKLNVRTGTRRKLELMGLR